MRWLGWLVCLVVGLAVDATALAQSRTTHVFKSVSGVDVQADVYRSNDNTVQPVLVWFHGGALINGSRTESVGWGIKTFCEEEGCILVVADYRLGPETKVADIASDVADLMRWIREEGPALFNADPDRLVMAGRSAGGYLAQYSGIAINPPPTAIASYWGYGNLLGDWYTKPSPAYQSPQISRSEAFAGVYQGVLTGTGGSTGIAKRRRLYTYLRQNGLWTEEMSGFDPETEADRIAPFCPVMNVTPAYPPTFLLHGERDSDVPVEESIDMAAELESHGVPHELHVVAGAGHGLGGASNAEVSEKRQAALDFMAKYLFGPLEPRPQPAPPQTDGGPAVFGSDGGTPAPGPGPSGMLPSDTRRPDGDGALAGGTDDGTTSGSCSATLRPTKPPALGWGLGLLLFVATRLRVRRRSRG